MRVRRLGNLPAETTGFVGRAGEIELGLRLLAESRLVTVTGPGGVGKTRVARRLAETLRRTLPGGVWHVELSEAADRSGGPAAALAETLGIPGAGPAEVVRELSGAPALVLLDGCDPVPEAAAELAERLLRGAPRLAVLVTGRIAVKAPGARVLTVPPLPPADAVRLFADRAAAVVPGFTLDPSTLPVVEEVCRRLDGLPLAVELAAARLRSLSVADLRERLADRFALLSGASRAALRRHRSLRAALEWSYELCAPAQRLLWERLSVFRGDFCLEMAERVCAGGELPREAVAPLLADLVDRSVVLHEHGRYRLLDALRELGAERLRARGRDAELVAARLRENAPAAEPAPARPDGMSGTTGTAGAGGAVGLRPVVPAVPGRPAATLTRRELQVAELISKGLSNRQIAGVLTIAKRTVDAHVRNILAKGGLTSRTHVATWLAASRH